VLFDLDGTLLDTAADIAHALNRALADSDWPPIAPSEVRRLIQHAAAAQGKVLDAAAHAAMVERFFHHYGSLEENNEFEALPYPGAGEALRALHEAGLRTAVVTNKQRRFARGLLDRLHLSAWVDCVVGGDSCERRKPDPQPLLFACEQLKASPSRSLMVGDSINDVTAARAASIAVICVPYGYNEGKDPRELPCDAIIETLADLPEWLGATSKFA
jgi:phosphoglycolate phosphatase